MDAPVSAAHHRRARNGRGLAALGAAACSSDSPVALSLQDGARIEASRVLLEDNRDAGLFAAASEVELADTVIHGTREQASHDSSGRGIALQDGARFVGSRLLLDDNREICRYADATEVILGDAVCAARANRRSMAWAGAASSFRTARGSEPTGSCSKTTATPR